MGPPMNLRQPCLHFCQDVGAMVLLRHPWSLPSPLSPPLLLGPPGYLSIVEGICLALPPVSPSSQHIYPRRGSAPTSPVCRAWGLRFCVRGPAGL